MGNNNSQIYYTIEEIQKHNIKESCWIISNNNVYDVTDYVSKHPGGLCILKKSGTDCTYDMKHHSSDAIKEMKKMFIGKLKKLLNVYVLINKQYK